VKKSLLAFAFAVALSTTAFAAAPAALRLPSGVSVTVVQPGSGAQPTATDAVKVNYRGTLANGTEFDNSAKHGGPATFRLNQVVPCFSQALTQMKIGEMAKVFCPSSTAYGSRDLGVIPPNSDLNFDIELLDIVH